MIEKSEGKISHLLLLTNTIFHQLVAVTFGYIFYILINNGLSTTRLIHYLCSAGAYIPLMAEGIILFNDTNTWTLHISRTKKAWIHGGLLAASIICVTIGISVQINAKDLHFQTNHSILGLVSWILCFLLAFSGVIALYSPKFKHYFRPVYLKTCHLCLGLSCYIFGIAALVLGLDKSGFSENISEYQLIVMKILVILIAIWSVLGALKSLYDNLMTIMSK